VKYLTAFDDAFWVSQGLAPSALWDRLGSVWEGTDRQTTPDVGFGLSVFAGGPFVSPAAACAARLSELYPGGPAPRASRYLDWPRTPYIGTGYAVPAPGQVTTIGRALSEQFADRLFFAGEQACMGFFGYMEGALQSGARAASNLVGRLCPRALPTLLA
jgi:monoamine oxidase